MTGQADTRWQQLLDDTTCSDEEFVRRSLRALERDFRRLALTVLVDWERTGLTAKELFSPLASLPRPSWGTWNGLLDALRSACRSILRTGDAPARAQLEQATHLRRFLQLWDEPLSAAARQACEQLSRLPEQETKRAKVSSALTLPISLRNAIEHGRAPEPAAQPAWWRSAAESLRQLIVEHAEGRLGDAIRLAGAAPPWILEIEGEAWCLNGLVDSTPVYVGPGGDTRTEPSLAAAVMLSLRSLLGQREANEQEFRRLLARLAPEEVRGVLLGDYLVGPPIGRGGFATVHVGRQLSTGRKVAVKVLHDGLSEEDRLRFRQEATYLARFNHQHIVGVVGFGEAAWSASRLFSLEGEAWYEQWKRSSGIRTFLVLEWVPGRTLEDVFQGASTAPPERKRLLAWFTQAADALGAVHATGLIHRDVKPGNLMVSDDDVLKLMDFGIARSQDEYRTIQTEAGNAPGTPAYMSPEQVRARGAADEVGPASDVYSLCATFFELFTRHRLYEHDRTDADTTRRMKLDGVRPARPRTLVSGLPWELETVLLGGLEPAVADRYRSMETLRSDLEHIARDEPIEYRRPSAWRRLRLAYRRNRAVANVMATSLAIIGIGTTAYLLSLKQARDEAIAARQQADQQRNLAIDSLNSLVFDVQEQMEGKPALHELKQKILNTAIKNLQRVGHSMTGDNVAPDRFTAVAQQKIGDLLVLVGSTTDAETIYRSAHATFEQLVRDDPGNRYVQSDLANNFERLGDLAVKQGNLAGARRLYEDGLAVARRLAIANPQLASAQFSLASLCDRVGNTALQEGQLADARKFYEESLALRKQQADAKPDDDQWQHALSISYEKLADVGLREGNLTRVRKCYEDSLAIAQRLAKAGPDNAVRQGNLATTLSKLGDLCADEGKLANAKKFYTDSLNVRQTAADADPNNVQAQRDLAISCDKLGLMCFREGKLADARKLYERALLVDQRRAHDDPSSAEAQRDLSLLYNRLGDVSDKEGKLADARKFYEDQTAILQRLAEADTKNAQAQRDLAVAYSRLGNVCIEEGKLADARRFFEDSLAVRQRRASVPDDAEAQRDLSLSFDALGNVCLHEGNLADARKYFEDSLAIDRRLASADLKNAELQRDLMISLNKLGRVCEEENKPADARKYYADGLEIARRLADAAPTSAQARRDLAISYNRLGGICVDLGQLADGRKFYEDSLAIARQHADANPNSAEAQRDLMIVYGKLGGVCFNEKNLVEARRLYQDGLTVAKRLADAAPNSAEALSDLSFSYNLLGKVCMQEGHLAEARRYFTDGMTIAKRLAEANPKSSDAQHDLMVSHYKLGMVAEAEKNYATVIAEYRESIAILKRMLAAKMSVTQSQRELDYFKAQVVRLEALEKAAKDSSKPATEPPKP